MRSIKYQNIEELRRKKKLLQSEINDLENLLTFKNTKESLSAFTNGLSDRYIQEKIDENGDGKVALRQDIIAKQLTSKVKNFLINKDMAVGLFNSAFKAGNITENLFKMGVSAIVKNYSKKNTKSSNWKKKMIGTILIYLAPIALKYIRKKIEVYHKNKSISNIEKLI